MELFIGMIAVIGIFIGIPAFIYKHLKDRIDLKKLEQQRIIMELEIEKQNNQIKLLEEENKKYDRIINGN